jgi:Type VI secretion system/phage-baseplate injector OB domain
LGLKIVLKQEIEEGIEISYFGKYRGKVEDNADPDKLGRVRVSVPAILGEGKQTWAMPCSPYAGKSLGLFALPPIGTNIWVEFEAGNLNCPIWSGCFWVEKEVPVDPAEEKVKIFKTDGIEIKFSDASKKGGLTIDVGPPSVSKRGKMIFSSEGIEISFDNSTIKLMSKGIEIKCASSSINITDSGIDITSQPGSIKLNSGGIDLVNGSSSIKMTSVSVNINKGALEVM